MLWTITYGDYEFIVDRRALTYRLTEMKTGTVWAENLSLGWVALESRETGEMTRHDFGSLQCVSVSEKSGPQGKRILFGLDLHGVPIDLYLICSQREIQIQLEANRDSKTHKIAGFGLVPDLCSVPDDGDSYMAVPLREGAMVLARDAPLIPQSLPVWDFGDGLTMPFVGAVRKRPQSSLALITDSAYGVFGIGRFDNGGARLNPYYSRDPERRRLDLRIVLTPEGDHISIARTYREKIIQENSHVTLRRKLRDRPFIEVFLGSLVFDPNHFAYHSRLQLILDGTQWLRDACHIQRAFIVGIIDEVIESAQFDSTLLSENDSHFVFGIYDSWDAPFNWNYFDNSSDVALSAVSPPNIALAQRRKGAFALVGSHCCLERLWDVGKQSRWDDLDNRIARCSAIGEQVGVITAYGGVDWCVPVMDLWIGLISPTAERSRPFFYRSIPLYAAVYHDCVITTNPSVTGPPRETFLRLLLNLALLGYSNPSNVSVGDQSNYADEVRRAHAVISPLHQLTFAAFLTAHRFLTSDYSVEEAIYSDKTRVVINQSETDVYETEEFALPPLGFYVRHSQMEAHDALRFGDEIFPTRAWRIRRSRDGKPLEQSADIVTENFAV